MGRPVYDDIGRTYGTTRREDPRIAAAIHGALGDARTVVNVGAGTGNYEPTDRAVVAVEPSEAMLVQRAGRPATAVRGVAEALPFPDGAVEAALAVLTVHHWQDQPRGLAELRRVAPRQVVFFFEPEQTRHFWALEYFAAAADVPSERNAAGERVLREHLDVREIRHVPVPRDCTDGFGAAFWARPEAYLDPAVQAGQSWLALLPPGVLAECSAHLADDLASGEWDRRHGHLRTLDELDAGYRIAIAGQG